MKRNLILVGGGGHCVSCIDVIESNPQYKILGILDTEQNIGKNVLGYPILGTDHDILKYAKTGCYFLITVGQIETAFLRISLYEKIIESGGKFAKIISSRAYVAKSSSIDQGTIVMHDALINANTHIGKNCIINSKALIEHDCHIKSNCHVSTGAVINGGVEVGERTFFGSNTVSKQGVKIKPDSFIKANTCFTGRTQKRVAVLTTIFPIKHSYIIDFFESLSSQTNKNFDVIIMNDGFCNFDVIKKQFKHLKIIELYSANNIARNRQALIQFAKNNAYDIAIFADVDDFFSLNRIEVVTKELKSNDIVVNDLTSVKDGRVLCDKIYSKRLHNRDSISLDFIKQKNIFGLSNTAINLDAVPSDFIQFPSDLIAVDWYFFSLLLAHGLKAIFVNNAITYYRQHDANTIGVGKLTSDKVKRIIQVKTVHYEHMISIFPEYKGLLARVTSIGRVILDSEKLDTLLMYNHKMIKHPLWWEMLDFRNEDENIN